MKSDPFIDQAWKEHAQLTEAVAERLKDFDPAQDLIPQFASLVTHVFGEHLGRWQEGITLLEKIQGQADSAENRHSLYRSITALKLAGGLSDQSDDLLASDQIRVLCVASAALVGQKQTEKAIALFSEALNLAEQGLDNSDPAVRSIAITGNNLAVALEQLSPRASAETAFMIRAARAALKYWPMAGSWVEHSVAHYRLCKSLMAAGQQVEALEEAMSCLAMCKTNNAGPVDLFWANEAVATVTEKTKPEAVSEYVAQMGKYLEAMNAVERAPCEARFQEFTRTAG